MLRCNKDGRLKAPPNLPFLDQTAGSSTNAAITRRALRKKHVGYSQGANKKTRFWLRRIRTDSTNPAVSIVIRSWQKRPITGIPSGKLLASVKPGSFTHRDPVNVNSRLHVNEPVGCSITGARRRRR
jgi:hypothetical protein